MSSGPFKLKDTPESDGTTPEPRPSSAASATTDPSVGEILSFTAEPAAPASFEALLRPHLDRLYRLAYRLTGNRPDAEDLVQDVLVKLYARRDELSSIDDLSPWVGRVLYNQFVDQRRRYRRMRMSLVDIAGDAGQGDALDRLPSQLPGPESHAAGEFDIKQVDEALARLNEDQRIAVLLHDAEGYSLEEIQRVTAVPTGTLKSRLHRARARLRELLADGT